jgi:ATP-dependent DNA helicase RecQ
MERNPLSQAVMAVQELERVSKLIPGWSWKGAAVIAREWHYLEPVRSYCEARGIPVQVAREEAPGFWRLRETQCLLEWLKQRPVPHISAAQISAWLEEQAEGAWWNVLREGATELGQEIGDVEIRTSDVIEWLAEWGRERRKAQKGLLLLSAHRAKGLEFDDVVVLDGGWDSISRGEDRDAPRRLYYVAMTRARRSLALVSFGTQPPFLSSLNDRSIVVRSADEARLDVSGCGRIYQSLDLSQVDLSYAGRLDDRHPSHGAIRGLTTGSFIRLVQSGNRWLITDTAGATVGRLAKKYQPPKDCRFVQGEVVGIIVRRKEDSADEYHASHKQQNWEVVVPELVFERL